MRIVLSLALLTLLSCKESVEAEPKAEGFVATKITVNGRGCSGGDNCSVCKNCSGCRHCARKGGTCGVCAPPEEETKKTKKGKEK